MENPAILSGAADIPDNRGMAHRHDLQAFAAEKTKARTNRAFVQDSGGADGTRTRDLCRDRAAF